MCMLEVTLCSQLHRNPAPNRLCIGGWFQGLGIHVLRQSSGAGELDRCLLLCLHETNTVTSPTLEDLTCCTCAILHSLLSHFTTAAHGHTCPMCLQLFTLVLFHVQECLAGRRDDEDGEDSSRNVCHRMRQAGMFADSTVTASSPKVPGCVAVRVGWVCVGGGGNDGIGQIHP